MRDIKKILVIKGPGIGDIITGIPLFRNLKRGIKNAKIYLFNEKKEGFIGRKILKNCPYLDGFITFDNNTSKYKKLKRILEIKKQRFDLIIDGYPTTKYTALFSFLIKGRKVYGCKNNCFQFLYNHSINVNQKKAVEIEADICKALGIKINDKDLYLELFFNLKNYENKIKYILKENKNKKIGIHLGKDFDRTRSWDYQKWVDLCNKLSIENKKDIFILGNSDNTKGAKIVVSKVKQKIIDLTGKTTLEETAAIIKELDLLICVNGGLMHIATAVGTPVIALSAASLPGWDPYSKNSITIRTNVCGPCGITCRRKNNVCMKSIKTETVLKAVNSILGDKH